MASRLEALIEQQKALAEKIEAVKAEETAKETLGKVAVDIGKALIASVKKHSLDISTLYGQYIQIVVGEDGQPELTVVEKVKSGNGKKASNGNGNGGNYEYKLADGRTFPRLVDAIEAMTGKPCELKHDGKTFEDGKPKLRYSRLTDEIKSAIEQVEKASQPEPEPEATEAETATQTEPATAS